ncbi:phosphatase PAP2 family protein [Aeromicrobium chenweiae]|uniref:Inositol phosphorylceramide synthase n=1 Tax=Aeromicrobium chenweiae TaxID=2079793 RepID=A0A2S0WK74_9ACTN|nr:phosphatase PAP2 family protein [Aeromicrobium chenweiae]AWB91749.1 inositol phosphorylceramide synthase [Aeromicrobium chenweiae]TGN32591.1 inositol phosphorylceramide synthase [Aeromicrobium chenweiae]
MTTELEASRTTPWTWRGPALLTYAIAFAVCVVLIGVPTDPFQLFAWLWLATVAFNVRAPWRSHLAFPRDWWPAFALLVLYLYSRGLSDEIVAMPVHWTMPIRFDEWIGGGTLPTQHLQDALCASPCSGSTPPRWYDEVLTTIYFTHFVAGLTLAVVLWLRDRAMWVPWMRRYVVINFAALVIYVLYPMAPPWLASKEGYVGERLPRLTGRGWDDLGLGGFHVALAKVGNPVAAMPSLHGGLAMLIALYGIVRLRSAWRWILLLYPLLMATALIYYAEHYVIDILAGWALAGLVMIGCMLWETRRAAPPRQPDVPTAPSGR